MTDWHDLNDEVQNNSKNGVNDGFLFVTASIEHLCEIAERQKVIVITVPSPWRGRHLAAAGLAVGVAFLLGWLCATGTDFPMRALR